jgi:hypothetical protein
MASAAPESSVGNGLNLLLVIALLAGMILRPVWRDLWTPLVL